MLTFHLLLYFDFSSMCYYFIWDYGSGGSIQKLFCFLYIYPYHAVSWKGEGSRTRGLNHIRTATLPFPAITLRTDQQNLGTGDQGSKANFLSKHRWWALSHSCLVSPFCFGFFLGVPFSFVFLVIFKDHWAGVLTTELEVFACEPCNDLDLDV